MIPWGVAKPFLRHLDPESAHGATVRALELGLAGRTRRTHYPALETVLWGRRFPNPLGLAAGFDKDARVVRPILRLGFGFIEVGTVTPKPQPGNPRPRLFRLDEDKAVINRLGFNSGGAEAAASRLATARAKGFVGVLGVNIGRNKDQTDAVADYVAGAGRLGPLADYLAVNVSSPNTPGLRELQEEGALAALLAAVRGALDRSCDGAVPPLLVKIAPDLSDRALSGIAALLRGGAADGVIVSNTTTGRPTTLRSRHRDEPGGLSGRPLFAPSTRVVGMIYRETGGAVPIIGVGGIAGPDEAYAKIRAGASLLALYTALVFQGPTLVTRILAGLEERLRAEGFARIADAVGADHR